MSEIKKINCHDLYKNRNTYSIEELIHNIDDLQIKIILHTQTLNATFCAKYILDEKRTTCIEDDYLIDIGYVLRHQKHIKREDLEYYYDLYHL